MKLSSLNLAALAYTKDNFRKLLDSSPADEVFSVDELVSKGYSRDAINHWGKEFPDNCQSLGTNKSRIWGSKKAIAELRRQLQKL